MQINLRPPKGGDEAELAILCGEMGYPSGASEVTARLLTFGGRDDHIVLVATDAEDKPIAWVHAHLSFRLVAEVFAELGGLVVSEAHRSQGIGERLLVEAERWGKEQGVSIFRVRSNVVRERAHGFYLRAGYEKWKTSYVFEKKLA
jgi:GNAT superfamily N-acetyltransferase